MYDERYVSSAFPGENTSLSWDGSASVNWTACRISSLLAEFGPAICAPLDVVQFSLWREGVGRLSRIPGSKWAEVLRTCVWSRGL